MVSLLFSFVASRSHSHVLRRFIGGAGAVQVPEQREGKLSRPTTLLKSPTCVALGVTIILPFVVIDYDDNNIIMRHESTCMYVPF